MFSEKWSSEAAWEVFSILPGNQYVSSKNWSDWKTEAGGYSKLVSERYMPVLLGGVLNYCSSNRYPAALSVRWFQLLLSP